MYSSSSMEKYRLNVAPGLGTSNVAPYLAHPSRFPQKELFIVIDSDGGMRVQTGDAQGCCYCINTMSLILHCLLIAWNRCR